ncbi:MAG: hypothetical protein ORN49_13660, partial [Rhodobacteraceae bacterium]|nr:hypothetical protein [Paracoccaceae bacterium]
MKKLTLFVSALALSAGMALAGPVEDTVAKMTADGYSNIEVKSGASTTKIEAVKDGQMVEITIDNENGQVIKSENESVSGDDQSAEEGDDNGGEQADDNGESHEDGD